MRTEILMMQRRRVFIHLAASCIGSLVGKPVYAGKTQTSPIDIDKTAAITTVHGRGRRSLIVVSDPYCPVCRLLEQELNALDDVTIYTLVLPRHESSTLMMGIWCQPDRAKTWSRWMTSRTQPGYGACPMSLGTNQVIADRYGIKATPTIIFPDGTQHTGLMRAQEINAKLSPDHKPVK